MNNNNETASGGVSWKSSAAQSVLVVAAIFFGMETYFGSELINERSALQFVCFPLALLVLWHGFRVNRAEIVRGRRLTVQYAMAIAIPVWQSVCILVNNSGHFLGYAFTIYLSMLPFALCMITEPSAERVALRRSAAMAIMLALPFVLFGWLGVYMWRMGSTNATLSFLKLPSHYVVMNQTHFEDNELILFMINSNLVAPIAFGGALLSAGMLLPSGGGKPRVVGVLVRIIFAVCALASCLVLILTQSTSAYIAFCVAVGFVAFCLTYRAFESPDKTKRRSGRAIVRAAAALVAGIAVLALCWVAADAVRDAIRWHPSSSLAEAIEQAPEPTASSEASPEAKPTVSSKPTKPPFVKNFGRQFSSKNIFNRISEMLNGDNRTRVWVIVAEMLRAEPRRLIFGISPLSLNEALSPYYTGAESRDLMEIIYNNNAHNSYLQTILSTGVPGLILWLIFVVANLLPAVRALMTKRADARIAGPIALCVAALAMAGAESHYFGQQFVVNLAMFASLGCGKAMVRE